MPIIEMPDKTRVRFPDDMPREQIQAMIYKKFPEADPAMGGKAYQFGRGVAQGAIFDPIEGIGQIVEHVTGKKLAPQAVRDWLKKVQERTEATTTGKVGRVAGVLGSMAVAPEAAFAGGARLAGAGATGLSRLARTARTARAMEPEEVLTAARGTTGLGTAEQLQRVRDMERELGRTLTHEEREAVRFGGELPTPPRGPSVAGRVARQAAVGAAAGTAQPVEPGAEDFATQKGVQALAGGILGGLPATGLGGLARYATHHHPFLTAGAFFNPGTHLPTLATLAALYGLKGVEALGPRAAGPIGGLTGEVLSGPREKDDAETE